MSRFLLAGGSSPSVQVSQGVFQAIPNFFLGLGSSAVPRRSVILESGVLHIYYSYLSHESNECRVVS